MTTIEKTIIGMIAACVLLLIIVAPLAFSALQEMDENGGLKALTERVWEGK